MSDKIHGKGKTSFDLIDRGPLAEAISITEGQSFLDLGCGSGAYLLYARELSGGQGSYAGMDLWEEGIESLRNSSANIRNIKAIHGDITRPLPFEDGSVDVCLVSTVLHDVGRDHPEMLGEISRILHSGGRLVAIEFKPISGPPGPPLEVRLSYNELAEMIAPSGLTPAGPPVDLGKYLYMASFKK